MNTTVILTLDTRRSKSDNTFPILLRISQNGISTQITTKVYVLKKDWDDKKRVIKSSYQGTESVARLNNYLQKKKSEFQDFLTKLDEQDKLDLLSVQEIKNLFENKSSSHSFFEYAYKLMEELKISQRIGNARSYKNVIGVLMTYCKGKDLKFEQLNLAFLNTFSNKHFEKGNTHGGLAVYMRTIRAIYNKAIKDGLVDESLYPFKNYTIITKKTAKRAINVVAIQSVIDMNLDSTHILFHARNYFLASYYMRGIPFVDMALLKLENIVNGRIQFFRQKTDKPYNIKITNELNVILEYYLKDKTKQDYIFPIVKYSDPIQQYNGIENARKRYNKKLKEIAKICNIEENLTSYVSRHSFATQAKNLGIPITAISEMLGHENIKTTQIYLDSLPSDMLDKYHEDVLKIK